MVDDDVILALGLQEDQSVDQLLKGVHCWKYDSEQLSAAIGRLARGCEISVLMNSIPFRYRLGEKGRRLLEELRRVADARKVPIPLSVEDAVVFLLSRSKKSLTWDEIVDCNEDPLDRHLKLTIAAAVTALLVRGFISPVPALSGPTTYYLSFRGSERANAVTARIAEWRPPAAYVGDEGIARRIGWYLGDDTRSWSDLGGALCDIDRVDVECEVKKMTDAGFVTGSRDGKGNSIHWLTPDGKKWLEALDGPPAPEPPKPPPTRLISLHEVVDWKSYVLTGYMGNGFIASKILGTMGHTGFAVDEASMLTRLKRYFGITPEFGKAELGTMSAAGIIRGYTNSRGDASWCFNEKWRDHVKEDPMRANHPEKDFDWIDEVLACYPGLKHLGRSILQFIGNSSTDGKNLSEIQTKVNPVFASASGCIRQELQRLVSFGVLFQRTEGGSEVGFRFNPDWKTYEKPASSEALPVSGDANRVGSPTPSPRVTMAALNDKKSKGEDRMGIHSTEERIERLRDLIAADGHDSANVARFLRAYGDDDRLMSEYRNLRECWSDAVNHDKRNRRQIRREKWADRRTLALGFVWGAVKIASLAGGVGWVGKLVYQDVMSRFLGG